MSTAAEKTTAKAAEKAPEDLRKIHDRMPLIFPQDKIGAWIDPNTKPEELLQYALTDMVFEKAV